MSVSPTEIERKGRNIEITWSDGVRREYLPSVLRGGCPCATCRERKNSQGPNKSSKLALPVLSKTETVPLEIKAMQPVGNYAYNIHFSDGHNSGIFTFDLLYSLGQPLPSD